MPALKRISKKWQRSSDCRIGSFFIAHLANENDVGVMQQYRPQSCDVRQDRANIDLRLPNQRKLVFDRIFRYSRRGWNRVMIFRSGVLTLRRAG
jgi:hypothetical protein